MVPSGYSCCPKPTEVLCYVFNCAYLCSIRSVLPITASAVSTDTGDFFRDTSFQQGKEIPSSSVSSQCFFVIYFQNCSHSLGIEM